MNYNINIPAILLALFMGSCAATAEGAVVIKVRAINSLDEEAPVTIHYPLPAGLTSDDVLAKRVARGKSPAAPAKFAINFDEDEKIYFVDYQITLGPKEIIVLEVEAKDIWTVPPEAIDRLKKEAADLLRPPPPPPEGSVSEEAAADPDPVALKLKEEISRQLEEIVADQKATAITQVGVQRHIEAYQKNREILRQVGTDIAMLRNMIAARQEQPAEEKPQGEAEVQGQTAPSGTQNASGAPASTSDGTGGSTSAGGGPAEQKQSVADKLKSLFRWK